MFWLIHYRKQLKYVIKKMSTSIVHSYVCSSISVQFNIHQQFMHVSSSRSSNFFLFIWYLTSNLPTFKWAPSYTHSLHTVWVNDVFKSNIIKCRWNVDNSLAAFNVIVIYLYLLDLASLRFKMPSFTWPAVQ